MKTYTEHIFEEFVQDDNSSESKIRRYLERKMKEAEERERNRPHPKTREELQDIIVDAIKENGPEVDLNYIDVSGIDDMHQLFCLYYGKDAANKTKMLQSFNGDISDWDVSSVNNMDSMFYRAENFNGNISDWDVSSVLSMCYMFCGAKNFNQNISDWKIDSVADIHRMFYYAENFNQDLSGWDVTGKNTTDMFNECPIEDKNKPKGLE